MAYDIFVQHPVINFLLKFFINLLFTIDRFGFECLIILPVSSLHARFNFMFSVCFRLKFLHCLKPNKDRQGDQVSVILADSLNYHRAEVSSQKNLNVMLCNTLL